jgi:transposase
MMEPKQEAQAALFDGFCAEDHVPQDHLLRSIDRFVDLSNIRQYFSDPIPNHSTFSKIRHGCFRESKLLRHLFEKTVARCLSDGLVSGQRLAGNASLIEVDANKQNSTPKRKMGITA